MFFGPEAELRGELSAQDAVSRGSSDLPEGGPACM
jgi:hypothetical protein